MIGYREFSLLLQISGMVILELVGPLGIDFEDFESLDMNDSKS